MRTALLSLTVPLAILVGLMQPEPKKKAPKPDVGNGRVAWFDITTTNMAKSREFYGKLFDWKFNGLAGMENIAAEIVVDDVAIGTLRKAEGAISAYDGVVYIQVSDAQASCKKAEELGAKVVPGFPFDLDDERGAIGLFTDPAGHPMGVYSRTPLAKKTPGK